jgi:hypothetical protein
LKKHRGRITGDHISTPVMFFQLLFFDLMIAFFILSIFLKNMFLLPTFFLIFVILFYLADILRITKVPQEVIGLFFIYFLRVLAWTVGIIFGCLKFLS